MKLKVLVFMGLSLVYNLSPASMARISRKEKHLTFQNIHVEARNRAISIYDMQGGPPMIEVYRTYTALPIRSISYHTVDGVYYIRAYCRLGSIERIKFFQVNGL